MQVIKVPYLREKCHLGSGVSHIKALHDVAKKGSFLAKIVINNKFNIANMYTHTQ